MATETVSSDHSEKEVKKTESETVAPPPVKESVAPEDSACPAAAPSTEPEAKIEDKHVEPVNESVDAATLVAEAVESKEVELPPKAEETKTQDVKEVESKVEEVAPAAPIVEEKPSEESGVVEAEPVGIVEVKTQTGEEKEPPAKETIEVQEKVSEPKKIEAETDENSVVTEEKVQCDDAKSSDPSTELEEKVVEEEVTDRDIKPESDHKEACDETEKVEAVEKIKETAQAMDEEIEDTKKPQDVPVKTQKQSIVKMVKQSLVKAKKAITGKSQNPKTPASEPTDDGTK